MHFLPALKPFPGICVVFSHPLIIFIFISILGGIFLENEDRRWCRFMVWVWAGRADSGGGVDGGGGIGGWMGWELGGWHDTLCMYGGFFL